MFLVMSTNVQTNKTNSNDNPIDANSAQDSSGGELNDNTTTPPTILFLHGNAGNIGHRYMTLNKIFLCYLASILEKFLKNDNGVNFHIQ